MNEVSEERGSTARSVGILAALVGLVFFQGWLAWFLIGDLGQPDWDYRPVPDVHGESAYALYPPMPYPQHIRDRQNEEAYALGVLKIPEER
ncbi:MAG: hypothetical protein WHT06_06705 [Desulfobacterales bacterium]